MELADLMNDPRCHVIVVPGEALGQTASDETAPATDELFADLPDLLTPKDLARLTGQCEATMRALCAKGELPAVRIGKRWYVPKTSFREYVEGGERHDGTW